MTCINGYWQLTAAGAAGPQRAGKQPSATGAEDLLKLLAEHGPLAADELARKAGMSSRSVAAMLVQPARQGAVMRQSEGSKYRYYLPEQCGVTGDGQAEAGQPESLPAEPAETAEPAAAAEPAEPAETAEPAAAAEPAEPAETAEPAAAAPLKVVWSAPEDFQVFPTRAWVRQQRRALQQEEREFNHAMKNKKRTLAQIDNLVRRVTRIQGGVARIEGQA